MPAEKKNPPAQPAANAAPAPAAAPARKAWIPKSPVDVVLDQIGRQEDRVQKLQAEIDAEKLTLNKLRKAKEVLEAS
jgi:hypothetical protein